MSKSELNIVLQGGSMETSLSRQPPTCNTSHSHIPVPKISSLVKHLDNRTLYNHQQYNNQQKQNGPKGHSRISVTAQRASLEKLQDSVNNSPGKLNINSNRLYNPAGLGNNGSNDVVTLRSNFERTSSQSSSSSPSLVSPAKRNCYENSKLNTSPSLDLSWKTKFQESERLRKTLLIKTDSVNREQADLQKKFRQLQKENETLHSHVADKDKKLLKLRTVSEAVCKEYEQLKRQYDVETGAMHKAMQQASQWYKQNRQLKRHSEVLVQQFLHSRPDGLSEDIDLSDEVDANSDADVEQLRETVIELSQEVARLQTELNAARLQEFEAQEQAALAAAQLDEEQALRSRDEQKLRELRLHKNNMERVSKMVADEVQVLKTQCDSERERAEIMKLEADRAQKERNVLAHQSALLMAEIGDDPNGRLTSVLQEVETLKRLLEEQTQDHQLQLQMLQDKLEEKETNVEFEIVEEKLKLAESELEMVVDRAERAEKSIEQLEEVVRNLEEKVSQLKNASLNVPSPPPPPPPPLPPMLPSGNTLAPIRRRADVSASSNNNTTVESDMENMLGINPKKILAFPQQPAIDDIINQIKGGRFTLKQTDKQREDEKKRRQEAESASPAVSEMLNILGTMRRRAKPIRQSFKYSDVST